MESTDFRIGNLITGANGLIGAIKNINHSTLRHYVGNELGEILCDYSQIKPIPLTEEWLLKLGFVEMEKSEYTLDTFELDGVKIWLKEDRLACFSDWTMCIITNVHQLQNLYHALTLKELTIKESVT